MPDHKPIRKAKILATLGPASRDPHVIESLLNAGANGVRINMSHGTQEEKRKTSSGHAKLPEG
jgi:pyruvate kinase